MHNYDGELEEHFWDNELMKEAMSVWSIPLIRMKMALRKGIQFATFDLMNNDQYSTMASKAIRGNADFHRILTVPHG